MNEQQLIEKWGILIEPIWNVTSNKLNMITFFQTEFDEYIATFSKKMGSFLQPRQDLSPEEAMKLGMKNEADEVEKFVQVIF